jgi:hypothetical protein
MLFPPLREDGDAVIAETTAARTVTLADLLTVPCVATTVPVVSAFTATDVAVKLALSAPSGTVTVAGTDTAGLLLTSDTVTPPTGATPVNVTLPTVDAPPFNIDATVTVYKTGAATVMVLVTVVPFAVAVVVTTVSVSTTSADTGKVAERAPSATVTDAGIVKIPLSAARRTSNPPAGARPFNVTVPTPDLPPVRTTGLYATALGLGAWTVSVPVTVVPLNEARTVALMLLGTVAVDAVKVALVAPAGTVTVAGTVTLGLDETNVTTAPSGPAAPLRVTRPVDETPPTTAFGVIATDAGTEGVIARVAVFV